MSETSIRNRIIRTPVASMQTISGPSDADAERLKAAGVALKNSESEAPDAK